MGTLKTATCRQPHERDAYKSRPVSKDFFVLFFAKLSFLLMRSQDFNCSSSSTFISCLQDKLYKNECTS